MSSRGSWQKVALAGAAGVVAFGVGALLRGHAGSADSADDVVAPAPRASAATSPLRGGADAMAPPPASRLAGEVAFNPFGALNTGAPATLGQPKEAPAAPKPVKQVAAPPAPPPAPVAPPLPFVAIGSIVGADVTDGQPVAFLQQQNQLLVVRAGQSVGTSYRVESINAQKIEFTYLPLMQRQSLPLAP